MRLMLPPRYRMDRHRRGFNILETLVAIGILTIAALAVIGMLPSMSRLTLDAKNSMIAMYLAQQELDIMICYYPSADQPWTNGTDYCTSLQGPSKNYSANGWPATDSHGNSASGGYAVRTWSTVSDANNSAGNGSTTGAITLKDFSVTVQWYQDTNNGQFMTRSLTLYGQATE